MPRQFRTVRQQYYYFSWLFPNDVLFFQVGKYFEFYRELSEQLIKQMGLLPIKRSNRGVRYGFPVYQQEEKARLLVSLGFSVIIISQVKQYYSQVQLRLPVLKITNRTIVDI